MIYEPLRAAKLRPWAFITYCHDNCSEIITSDGEVSRCTRPESLVNELGRLAKSHTLLTANLMQLLLTTDARGWTARQRRSRIGSIRHDNGARVVVLPAGTFTDRDPDLRYAALHAYLSWLAGHGVGFTARTSWSTLGMMLWRSSLTRTVRLVGPDARAAMYGGRKEAPFAWRFGPCSRWDLSAAYPAALAEGMPSRLVPVVRPGSVLADSEIEGLASANVTVPDVDPFQRWAPLPMVTDPRSRKHLAWRTGELSGFWPLSELRQAADAGCTVEIVNAWAGSRDLDTFAAWWSLVIEARDTLPAPAARLAKFHSNLLWSSFAVSASPIVWKRWADRWAREPYLIKKQDAGGDPSPTTVYVSAITAGRVRARLWREGLLRPDGSARRTVVYADTDGFIAGADETPNGSHSGRPGEWRREGELSCVEIRHASAYRWRTSDNDEWRYRVAGAAGPAAAERRFRHSALGRGDVELPGALSALDMGRPDFQAREVRAARHEGRYGALRGRGSGSRDRRRNAPSAGGSSSR